MGSKHWTEAEDEILRQHYGVLTVEAIANFLLSRDAVGIGKRAHRLGLKSIKTWLEWEDKIIKQNYTQDRGCAERLHALLPHRTVCAIQARAARLGLSDPRIWTVAEDEILKQRFEFWSYADLEKALPNRTRISIIGRAYTLALIRSEKWTEQELELIDKHYDPRNISFVANLLPRRTRKAIKDKAVKLGLTSKRIPWTCEDDEIIVKHYAVIGCLKTRKKFFPNRTLLSVRTRAFKLGVNTQWTEEEICIVKEHYQKTDWKTLRRLIPRHTVSAIRAKAQRSGVGDTSAPVWTSEDVSLLHNQYPEYGAIGLQAIFPLRTQQAIITKAFKSGVCKHRDSYLRVDRYKGIHKVDVPKALLKIRFDEFGGDCPYCAEPMDFEDTSTYHWDHFLPASRGGSHTIGNLIPTCCRCNFSKNVSDPYTWYSRRPFFNKKRWQKILSVLGKTHATYKQIPLL